MAGNKEQQAVDREQSRLQARSWKLN